MPAHARYGQGKHRCEGVLLSWLVIAVSALVQLPPANASDSPDQSYRKAIQSYQLTPIRALVDDVSDVDLTAPDGRTALMIAARKGDRELVDKLLKKGASVTHANNNGGTPLMYAVIPGYLDIVERMLTAGANINATGSNGWGALMIAAAKGHAVITNKLLDAGADPKTIDIYAWTPLMRASFEGRATVVDILIDAKPSVIDAADDQGATALHHATAQGHIDIVQALLAAGANPYRKDHDDDTPLDYARQNNHAELIKLLSND